MISLHYFQNAFLLLSGVHFNQDVKGNLTDNQFEKELYDQSLEVEPRDQPYKKVVSVTC